MGYGLEQTVNADEAKGLILLLFLGDVERLGIYHTRRI